MILSLVLAGEGGALWRVSEQAKRSTAAREAARRRVDLMQRQSVDRRRDLAEWNRIEAEMASFRNLIPAADDQSPSVGDGESIRPLEALVAIRDLVERCRENAQASGLGLRPGEDFSFGAYSNEGPPTELIPSVLQQARIVEGLVDFLIDAAVDSLESIERTDPAWTGTLGERARAGYRSTGPHFSMPSEILLPHSDQFQSQGVRVRLRADAASLRRLVGAISSSSEGILLRLVEVEAATVESESGISPIGVEDSQWAIDPSPLQVTLTLQAIARNGDSVGKPVGGT